MSATIYVGRLPFDYTEEQVADLFKSAGPIKETRLVFDKENGRSKGFAFVEFVNQESAATAVRNLNNQQVGKMNIKVDFSEGQGSSSDSATLTAYIADLINDESSEEKQLILKQAQAFAQSSPGQLSTLLSQKPQLAFALVQTMVNMGSIDPTRASSLIQGDNSQNGADIGAGADKKRRGGRGRANNGKPAASSNNGRAGQAGNTQTNANFNNQGLSKSDPPADQAEIAPELVAPTTDTSSATPQRRQVTDPKERAVLQQVQQLTPETIANLPAEQQTAILDLRNKMASGEIYF